MSDRLKEFGNWAREHFLELGLAMLGLWSIFALVYVFSGLFGFWANGFYPGIFHFDIQQLWPGISIILGGYAAILGFIGTGCTVFHINSKYNTMIGSTIQDPQTKASVTIQSTIGDDKHEPR